MDENKKDCIYFVQGGYHGRAAFSTTELVDHECTLKKKRWWGTKSECFGCKAYDNYPSDREMLKKIYDMMTTPQVKFEGVIIKKPDRFAKSP